jgi:hypothetical protein
MVGVEMQLRMAQSDKAARERAMQVLQSQLSQCESSVRSLTHELGAAQQEAKHLRSQVGHMH